MRAHARACGERRQREHGLLEPRALDFEAGDRDARRKDSRSARSGFDCEQLSRRRRFATRFACRAAPPAIRATSPSAMNRTCLPPTFDLIADGVPSATISPPLITTMRFGERVRLLEIVRREQDGLSAGGEQRDLLPERPPRLDVEATVGSSRKSTSGSPTIASAK